MDADEVRWYDLRDIVGQTRTSQNTQEIMKALNQFVDAFDQTTVCSPAGFLLLLSAASCSTGRTSLLG